MTVSPVALIDHTIRKTINDWLAFHARFLVGAGPIHRRELERFRFEERIVGGWTALTLTDHGKTIAQARYRLTDDLMRPCFEWEPLEIDKEPGQ
jgi:hypothetical protein